MSQGQVNTTRTFPSRFKISSKLYRPCDHKKICKANIEIFTILTGHQKGFLIKKTLVCNF